MQLVIIIQSIHGSILYPTCRVATVDILHGERTTTSEETQTGRSTRCICTAAIITGRTIVISASSTRSVRSIGRMTTLLLRDDAFVPSIDVELGHMQLHEEMVDLQGCER